MAVKNLWDKQTGKLLQVEPVDYREIMQNSPDRYTDVKPDNGQDLPVLSDADRAKQVNLRQMSMTDLRTHAGKLGIDLDGLSRQDEIIAQIEMHQANQPTVTPPGGIPGNASTYPTAPVDANPAPGLTAKNAAEEEDEEEGTGDGTDFNSMTVADLKAHAEENSIDLGDATKKADIVAKIEEHHAGE